MNNNQSLYVLIAGIDKWINPQLPPLKGCVRDAELMTSVFRDRFAVPDENIVVLTNEEATRQAITDAFRTHLIDQARSHASKDSVADGPSFVFYYAGHGSRAKDGSGTQPDGLDETIVPYDSRTADVFDIKDWEIGAWLDELTAYTRNVAVILDCCHSGSGTRDTDSTGTARLCSPDLRDQPAERPDQTIAAGTRSSGGSAIAATNSYTALAACRNYEFAQEYTVRDGKKRFKHGAFTYFLAQELMQVTPGSAPTYREIFERVRYQVHKRYRSQMPQCAGDRDRLLFGGASVVRDPLMTIEDVKKKDGSIWVDAGQVHGLSAGAKLTVYPPETRTIDEHAEAVGTLTVEKAEAVRSRCTPDDNIKVQRFSRVAVSSPGSSLKKHVIAIDIPDDEDLLARLEEEFESGELNRYAEVTSTPDASADYTIGLSDDEELTIHDASGKLLVQPVPMDQPDLVAGDLAALCRYHNVLDLNNHSRSSGLRGKIEVHFHTVVEESAGTPAVDNARNVRKVTPIAKTPDGVPIIEIEKPIAIEIRNNSDKPLFCEAISFGYDFAIVPLTSLVTGSEALKRVDPGSAIWLGRDESDELIRFRSPSDPVDAEQFTQAREFLKVIATEDAAEYEILRQDGLRIPVEQTRSVTDSALSELFSMAMSGTRALGVKKRVKDEKDWTTTELEYLVTRPQQETSHSVTGGERVTLPEYDISVEPPQNLNCQVRVLTDVDNVRSVGEGQRERPSGSVWEGDFLEPVSLASRRSTAPAGTAIEIEADTDALSGVCAEEPIRLHLPDEEEPSTVAIAWDGEFAFPVGASRDAGCVTVDWLPNSNARQNPEDVAEGSRSLMRCVKLYLYRVGNRQTAELGLRQVETVGQDDVTNGDVHLRSVSPEDMRSGQRVAVVISGFPASSASLVSQIHSVLTESRPGYDHILTFDYEGYGTPVGRNARTLFQELKAAGFHNEDEIHLDIIAHGSGAIVARAMIELENGHRFVDRCFCIGSPNQGSALLMLKEAVSFLGAFMLNSCYRGSFGAAFLTFLLRQVVRDGKGFADLATNSQFLDRLDSNGKRGSIEYHLLAGRYQVSDDHRDYLQRLWDRICSTGQSALGVIFGEEHDMVANTPSMLNLSKNPGESTPESSAVVDCHHFDYFSNPQALAELSQRL